MNYEKGLYYYLSLRNIQFHENKNPIKMNLFLSFLTIPVVKIEYPVGHITGWTKYENKEHGLIICGKHSYGNEYLDNTDYNKGIFHGYHACATIAGAALFKVGKL